MTTPRGCVIDTTVLQKANAPIIVAPKPNRRFEGRIRLLRSLSEGKLLALISPRLMAEYRRQVAEPRNDTIKAFFEILTNGQRHRVNWPEWTRARRSTARSCKFPPEDDHVLRTAICPDPTLLFTEEKRMLDSGPCILRKLRVRIVDPQDV